MSYIFMRVVNWLIISVVWSRCGEWSVWEVRNLGEVYIIAKAYIYYIDLLMKFSTNLRETLRFY